MMERNCHCPSRKKKAKNANWPILGGILIALIPKCPFCILAYSSAMTLCSGSKIYNHTPEWTSWISITLSLLTLALVFFNYRGRRTLLAAAFIIFGSFFIIKSELQTGDITGYYLGAILLMFGVWVNASFYYLFNRWIKPLFPGRFSFSKPQSMRPPLSEK